MPLRKSKQEVLDFLKREYIMNVATISGDNKPHASVLLYTVDDDFTIYFVTHSNTYKAADLQKNPSISLSVWCHGEMMVQADGTASVIEDEEKKQNIIDKLIVSSEKGKNFWPPLLRFGGHEYTLFAIKPHWMRALDLTSLKISEKESPFTEINL